jgi:hypothetical protein
MSCACTGSHRPTPSQVPSVGPADTDRIGHVPAVGYLSSRDSISKRPLRRGKERSDGMAVAGYMSRGSARRVRALGATSPQRYAVAS